MSGHVVDAHVLVPSHLTLFLSSGHVSASRRVWDDHADRSDHREPVVSGEQRSAEPLQGSGAGEAERIGDELDSPPG